MSRKGNPYDNAVAENFFSNMKCDQALMLSHFDGIIQPLASTCVIKLHL